MQEVRRQSRLVGGRAARQILSKGTSLEVFWHGIHRESSWVSRRFP
jgi:hypothetical protein